MKGKLIFNDVSSEDLGVVIQTPPTYEYPERVYSSANIPGRNGDLVIDEKSYKNVERTYDLAKGFGAQKHYVPNAEKLLEWLTSAKGHYVRLEDTYDPDVYRLAMYTKSGSFTNYYDQALSFKVTFECKPQRFLKSGEEIVEFSKGPTASIENPFHYESLPLIKIEGIQKSLSNVLMLTIENSGNVTSSISITDVDNNVVYIDSTEQNCYDNQGDINDKISLNGNDFPKLNGGINKLTIAKFEKKSGDVSAYNSVIAENQSITKSEYKPYDVLESAEQSKVYIKPYETIIESKQDSFEANSYQTYVQKLCDSQEEADIADTYTFKSFNTLLSNYGEQCSFSGDIGGTTFPSWVRVNQNGDYLNVYANITGYFMISSGNSIRLYNANDLIATVKKNGTTTVYYYEMDTSTRKPVIKYDDLPSWLDFVLDTIDDGNQKVLSKISFILKKAGFVWKDKNTLFGKASWQKLTANTVLNELTWNNVKKAFMPTTGISTSTTATYTYRWLDHVVQYKPEEDSELTFKIEVPGNDFNSIAIKSVVSGYFKIIVNGKIDAAEWVQISAADSQIALIKGTDSFEIDYLESVPSYENEEDWPDWLNPNPKLTYTKNPLMATAITFYVTKKAKYRFSYNDTEGNEQYSDWVDLNAGDYINMSSKGNKKITESFYICKIDAIPTVYPEDRAFDDSATPPNWLQVEYFDDPDSGERKIRYLTNLKGYFKWDSNSTWLERDPNEELLITGIKENTTLYFMGVLPSYPDFELSSKLNITPVADSTGNPTEIKISVKEAGYYRCNSNSNWVWYNVGDELIVATIGERVRVNYLDRLNDDLSNLKISIIPHWWML